jgi:putative secretion ATPase (PEP-CTERM system associated)
VFDKFYKLTGQPFLLTPDTRFFYGSSGHSRAIAHLVYGLAQQEGFIVITGEVGAGKTMLTEQLWSQLDRNSYLIARVVTTQVSGDDLFRLAMQNFGLGETQGLDKATLIRRFEQMVREQRLKGRRCLLVIDETQNLPLSAMEELRMLSNITVDGKASVQTILLGQPQFRTMLAGPDWEQLRQRVLASHHLGPLTAMETRLYIKHRLRLVNWKEDPTWDDESFPAIFRQTGGIPRRINTLCSRLMLFAALEEAHNITAEMVDKTADELARDLGAGIEPLPNLITRPSSDALPDLVRRIEMLERNSFLQKQAFKRMLELLESM